MAEFIDTFLRLWLIMFGLLVAGHYHCMANFITLSPAWVKLLAGVTTAAGTGMVVCGYTGDIGNGALFSMLVTGPMAAIQLGAWAAGARVSEQFLTATLVKQQGWRFVRDQEAMAEVARLAAANSDMAPLDEKQKSN